MTNLLDLASRLGACWLDIMSPEDESRDDRQMLSRCANMISEARTAMRDISVPKPIDNAPDDDRWILAYDPGYNSPCPWVPATRCDGGWHDEAYNGVDPTMWVPLPDPQPEPTGWRKAEGTIRIIKAWSQQIPWLTHLVEVITPDGEPDKAREPDMATSIEDARRRAAAWAIKLGLPVIEVDDKNVLPFQRKGPTQ